MLRLSCLFSTDVYSETYHPDKDFVKVQCCALIIRLFNSINVCLETNHHDKVQCCALVINSSFKFNRCLLIMIAHWGAKKQVCFHKQILSVYISVWSGYFHAVDEQVEVI